MLVERREEGRKDGRKGGREGGREEIIFNRENPSFILFSSPKVPIML